MPMKVVVCFDHVKVTVPCGDGNIPVQELINKAVHRYKRATGKTGSHWVEVTSLKTISGGGLLDPDDLLSDVVDDREQLIAEFEEQDRPSIQPNGGDGASASSTGTGSPDIFHGGSDGSVVVAQGHPLNEGLLFPPSRIDTSSSNNTAATDVVVTPRDLSIGSNLRVRRGSEPSLNLLVDEIPLKSPATLPPRPVIPRRESIRDSDEPRSESSDDEKRVKVPMYGSLDRKKLGQNRFVRDAFRTSLSNGPEMFRWLDAQDRLERRSKENKSKERTGPVDGHDGKDVNNAAESDSGIITLQNDGGPLGIHAVPAQDKNGQDIGLLIQSVEPGRPVSRDGRIQAEDIITQINNTSLWGVSFLKAQEVFRAAMDNAEIHLKVLKAHDQSLSSSSSTLKPSEKHYPAPRVPPVLPKPRSHIPAKPSPLTTSHHEASIKSEKPSPSPKPAPRERLKHSNSGLMSTSKDSEMSSEPSGKDSSQPSQTSLTSPLSTTSTDLDLTSPPTLPKPLWQQSNSLTQSANGSRIKQGPQIKPLKKAPPPPPPIPPKSTAASSVPIDIPLNAAYNTRKLGKKLTIQLKKGPLGLGFSVTSRDNQTDGNNPIYIRNILPKGPAVIDGQLRPGDRLLKVNDVEMTGKTQAEAVAVLRMLPEGSEVTIVVSRQEEVEEKFKVPRKLDEVSAASTQSQAVESSDQPAEGIAEVKDQQPDMADGGEGDVISSPVVDVSGVSLPPSQPSHLVQSVEDVSSQGGQAMERITFDIQLNDTGSAGLGVSVKGKTEPVEAGLRDLGIFVNSVLSGGAASKDGRLKVNDQLLEVNGVRLEGISNTAAMEALRMAMMDQTQVPGFSTITIARRTGVPSSPFFSEDSSAEQHFPLDFGYLPQRSVSEENSRPPIIHQRSSSATETSITPRVKRFGSEKEMPSPIPPVRSKRVAALRERFSESGNGLRNESYTKATHESVDFGPAGLRNDSYMKATHDTLNESAVANILPSPQKAPPSPSKKEEESEEGKENVDTVTDPYSQPNKPQRPHTSMGFQHGVPRISTGSVSDDEAFRRESVASSKDECDLSPSDLILPFAREGFGRQSMSEKRKGHLDPRSTETYKLVKANKDSKSSSGSSDVKAYKDVRGNLQFGEKPAKPSSSVANSMVHEPVDSTYQPKVPDQSSSMSNLKRASSFEDLAKPLPQQATAAPSISSSSTSQPSRDTSPMWRTNRFGRARPCNESFRAAVDRSYDALDPALMDTLEEESAETGAFTQEPSNSGRSSISSENTNEDTNSLKRRRAKEKEKKSAGLLKGFLRFGKGRKSNEEAMRRSRSEERSADLVIDRPDTADNLSKPRDRWANKPFGDAQSYSFIPVTASQNTQQRGRRTSQQEQERVEEEYARLREFHVSDQRLRSQSVDPTLGRNKLGSNSSVDCSGPFQPYQGSYLQQERHQKQQQQMQYQQQRQQQQHNQNNSSDPRTFHPAAMASDFDYREHSQHAELSDGGIGNRPNITKAVMSRAEYIQQLRSLYQQKHRQRQGVYPVDDKEEYYERQIQDMERKHWGPLPSDGFYEPRSRDSSLSRINDRPSHGDSDIGNMAPRTSSSSIYSANYNQHSSYSQHRSHQNYSQQQFQNSSDVFYRGPESYGNLGSSQNSLLQHHEQKNQWNSHNPYHPQQQQQHPQRGRSEESRYPDQYSTTNNYSMYDNRLQDQFYRGPSQGYHTAPHLYRTGHPDHSSAKV